jgi:hypothetical protein
MIRECKAELEVDLPSLDYSGIVSLAKEIGILDTRPGVESFERQGLI